MEKIGHRGAKGYVAENTIASINKAIALKVDAIEVDVHVCKTGELIVLHDETIDRTTTGVGKIRKITLKKLRTINSQGYPIPLLEEVLELCSGKCKVHIELKGKGTAVKVAHLIEKFVAQGKYDYQQIYVSSFVKKRLIKIRKQNANIQLGIIVIEKNSKALKVAVKNGFEAIYVHHKQMKLYWVRIAKLKQLKIYVWTVNKPKKINKIKKLEVQGIISDFPDRLC